jgi:hypothetical protein
MVEILRVLLIMAKGNLFSGKFQKANGIGLLCNLLSRQRVNRYLIYLTSWQQQLLVQLVPSRLFKRESRLMSGRSSVNLSWTPPPRWKDLIVGKVP